MAREKQFHTLPDGEGFRVQLGKDDTGYNIRSAAPDFNASAVRSGGSTWSVLIDGRSYEARVERDERELHVEVLGSRFRFGIGALQIESGPGRRGSGRSEIKAPMPGKVVKLLVAEGDAVTAGQGILLFEAMKMQNEIRSPQDGVVGKLAVEEGDPVDARAVLFTVLQE